VHAASDERSIYSIVRRRNRRHLDTAASSSDSCDSWQELLHEKRLPESQVRSVVNLAECSRSDYERTALHGTNIFRYDSTRNETLGST
jgi:hypothetical protein